MNSYINGRIKGLPKPLREGYNTSPTSRRTGKEYIHTVVINGCKYYKVHVKRQGTSKIRYFKQLKQAKLCVKLMRLSKAL